MNYAWVAVSLPFWALVLYFTKGAFDAARKLSTTEDEREKTPLHNKLVGSLFSAGVIAYIAAKVMT